MRAIAVIALAALLCAGATASEQGEAKALEDRWANCSAVKNGRLGALHPFGEDGYWHPFVIAGGSSNYTVRYAPCQNLNPNQLGGVTQMTVTRNDYYAQTWTFRAVPSAGGEVAEFHMPLKQNDVARFTANLITVAGEEEVVTASVESRCGHYEGIYSVVPTYATVKSSQGNGMSETRITHFAITGSTPEACPRFPYSNKGVPAGGVAALVIVVMCFVIQFSICGWYHKTYSHDVPFRESYGADADAAENAQ